MLQNVRALSRSLLFALLSVSFLVPVLHADELYRCTRVIDGDTIELETIGKVRLIGVDTPERKEAAAFTRELVEGKNVRLEYDQRRRDTYNRTLAYVFLEDSTFVNASIISLGHGSAYTKYPFRYLDEFRRREREARKRHLGLWAPVPVETQQITAPAGENGDGAVTVYITRTGTKYHQAGCRYLARSAIPIALSEAALSYSPCSVCDPPTLSSPPPQPSRQSFQQNQPASPGRCQATTKKGTQCKRNAKPGSAYCWQHGG
jgi:micrococcal nuclease